MLTGLFWLFYYPLRVDFIQNRNGDLYVEKRDWFFVKKSVNISKNQKPFIYARRRRMVGNAIYVGTPVYQPIVKYDDQEFNLIFTAAYFMRGIGMR